MSTGILSHFRLITLKFAEIQQKNKQTWSIFFQRWVFSTHASKNKRWPENFLKFVQFWGFDMICSVPPWAQQRQVLWSKITHWAVICDCLVLQKHMHVVVLLHMGASETTTLTFGWTTSHKTVVVSQLIYQQYDLPSLSLRCLSFYVKWLKLSV